MAKVRQDAWSHEDDLLLAETVLRHIREGSTQLNAFDEVGDELNRTSAACGFRWNAEVRNKYIHAIDLAKRQRKEMKRSQAFISSVKPKQTEYPKQRSFAYEEEISSEITIDKVLVFLKDLKQDYYVSTESKASIALKEKENESLKEKIEQLKAELEETRKQLETIQDDYQTFIQIMDRARKMTVFQDEQDFVAPSFRMDKNGNLEQLINQSK